MIVDLLIWSGIAIAVLCLLGGLQGILNKEG